jgi:beta-lactam-binding protein with PASTA domain
VRVRILMVAVLAATLVACDGSPSVEVPDLVGLTLPEAREHAGDFELEEVDASGLDRGVWSPSNWSVAEQEPQAGTPVQPRSTVRVLLVNVRDDAVRRVCRVDGRTCG